VLLAIFVEVYNMTNFIVWSTMIDDDDDDEKLMLQAILDRRSFGFGGR
jgi:hypothetical protein